MFFKSFQQNEMRISARFYELYANVLERHDKIISLFAAQVVEGTSPLIVVLLIQPVTLPVHMSLNVKLNPKLS